MVMDDLLSEFLTETAESLEVVDTELVKFEANPNERAVLDNIFRLVHTIKGTCGFLALPRLEALAHAGETLLGRFRDGALAVTPEAVTLVLQSIDRIKDILSHLGLVGVEPEGQDRDLIGALEAMSEGGAPAFSGSAPAVVPAEPNRADPVRVDMLSPKELDLSDAVGPYDPELGRNLRPGEVSMADLEAAFQAAESDMVPAVPIAEPAPATAPVPAATMVEEGDRADGGIGGQTIRVGVDILETLMTSVSELVLTRNQLLQMLRALDDSEFKAPLQRLSVITGELQESVMKTRMQPIGAAWKKLPRIVRDVSRDVGKKIDLVMEGENTELDRQVLELIKDPLTHMVRNSADHGLEDTPGRRAAGKPDTGVIRLSAFHEGGFIVIRIADDGRGLNTDRIREKVVANNLVTASEAATLTDAQVHRYIFAAGFSTAEQVTSLSGRGVGMDVVRTNIEQIGGQIDLVSVAGKGTTFTIKIPLTLAIISTLIVKAAGQRFAIPQLNVKELIRTGGDAEHRVEMLHETRVLRLRDRLLPLVGLSDFLRLTNPETPGFVVVMEVGGRQFGVAVDDVFDTEEIVVKPLAQILRDVAAFSGATILGDGSVVLILDPNTLAQAVGELKGEEAELQKQTRRATGLEITTMLVVRAGDATPKAVPLALVTRLEDVPADTIERSSGRAVVQYRGKLMPLLTVAPDQKLATEGKQPVLVFADGERVMGLAVDEIVDIVEEELALHLSTGRKGVVGSAVLKGRTTDVLDVSAYLTEAFSDWFDRDGMSDMPAQGRRVLLVDDSAFFRHMVSPLLSAAGYEVTTVGSAEEAWSLHADGVEFDAIISDIEMPEMDGFTFAQKLIDESRWASAPRIALTGLPVEQALKRAPQGAFRDVVRKSDRDALIISLDDALNTRRAA
jgi:two-component system chemotaxis sensor kinase CheA